MNLNIIQPMFLFYVVVQVRSCDDYFKCLGDFVHNFFGDTNVTEVESATDNVTEFIDIDDLGNETVSFFDVSQIGKTLTQALTDVAALINDEIKVAFNVDKEIDFYKELDNKTEIHAKAFSLSKKDSNVQVNSKNSTEIIIPKIIENNLTQFNDELSALKVEIENNLKAEIEAFISQVLDNDAFDWVEVTENSLYDHELITTTEISSTDKDVNDESKDCTTEGSLKEDIITVDEAFITSTLKPPVYTTKHPTVFMKSSTGKSEKESTVPKLVKEDKNKNVINITTTTKSPIYTTKNPTIFMKRKEFETKSKTKKTPSTHNDKKDTSTGKSQNNNTMIIIPLINTIASTKGFSKNTDMYTTIAEVSPTSSPKPGKETILTSTSSTTAKIDITTPKPTEKVAQIEGHTKSPIDYKLIENFKLNEISRNEDSYYDIPEDNSTDYPTIDYAEIYKDTTNEPVEYVSTPAPKDLDVGGRADLEEVFKNDRMQNLENSVNSSNETASVLPWLAAIFVKNGSNNQFDYVCDGALVADTTVLTAATCVLRLNATIDADDVIVFLGKRSLQTAADGETIHKVKTITLHANFTLHEESAANDLATLQLESPAVFSDSIAPACVGEGEVGEALTTAWSPDLSPIELVERNKTCAKGSDGVFCASYGNQVTTCPSYGSVFYGQSNTTDGKAMCIYGIRTTVGLRAAICFDRTITYTSISKHRDWLNQAK